MISLCYYLHDFSEKQKNFFFKLMKLPESFVITWSGVFLVCTSFLKNRPEKSIPGWEKASTFLGNFRELREIFRSSEETHMACQYNIADSSEYVPN